MAYYNSYNPKLLEGVTHIHFIGCGGSGMYPLIQILHAKGYTMSGSDVEETKITQAERAMGMKVMLGHDAANVLGAQLSVHIRIFNFKDVDGDDFPRHFFKLCFELVFNSAVFSDYETGLCRFYVEKQLVGGSFDLNLGNTRAV